MKRIFLKNILKNLRAITDKCKWEKLNLNRKTAADLKLNYFSGIEFVHKVTLYILKILNH